MIRLTTLAVLATFLGTTARAQVPPPPPQQAAVQYEVQARGPVHEAFATIVDGKLAPTPVVTKAPPAPLNEQPPDLKPEGDDVEWIGGYWYWSDDQNDYLWVSGCWRDAPPGRDWLPGQWVRARDGYHWVSGAWLPEGTTQVALLPPPHEPIEEDAGNPPTATSVFVPGTWVWKDARYVWRPGQWIEQPAEWVWQPAHYIWTPSGYVFVEGYWDHPIDARGLLYAPAAFPANVAVNRFVYVPQYVIRPTFLESALFVRAATKHYFFGDYFEPRYQTAGYVPWFDYRPARAAYDPVFAHYRAYHRANDWERTMKAQYASRYEGRTARPPRTWAQQQQALGATPRAEAQRAAPLVSVAPTPNVAPQQVIQQIQNVTNVKVEQVAEARKAQLQQQAEKRREAAKVYQESQTQRLTQQGGAAAPPKAPVEVKVPALPPRATQPAPQPQPPPQTQPPPKQGQPPVTPPKQTEQPRGQAKGKKAPPPTPQLPQPKDMKGQPKKDDGKKDDKKKGDG